MNLTMMVRIRETVLIKQPMPLGDALILGRSFQSTDPRDKVYGLLGIIGDEFPNSLTPDYNKPAAELYIDTMRHLLSHHSTVHNLHPFFLASIGFPRSAEMEKVDLPSWVVDWAAQTQDASLQGHRPFQKVS